MKVLYLSAAQGADYQCDMLFHGLRTLLGPDCVDVNRLHFMYKDTPYPPFYTVYGLLPEISVNREDILAKISAKYFDAIIYGSVHRDRTHLDLVKATYPPSRIVFIDGEDDHSIVPVLGQGLYFKRELPDGHDGILPIEFAVPREKIIPIDDLPEKFRVMAPCDPRDRSTYVYYGDESAYYRQYAESFFAFTMKKGGWDCCRHYEIMAAGALPYFDNLEACPARTMAWLPREALQRARSLHDSWQDSRRDEWDDLMAYVRMRLVERLTTEAMAAYVLDKVAT